MLLLLPQQRQLLLQRQRLQPVLLLHQQHLLALQHERVLAPRLGHLCVLRRLLGAGRWRSRLRGCGRGKLLLLLLLVGGG